MILPSACWRAYRAAKRSNGLLRNLQSRWQQHAYLDEVLELVKLSKGVSIDYEQLKGC